MKKHIVLFFCALLISSILLQGCGDDSSITPVQTATPMFTATPQPTATPLELYSLTVNVSHGGNPISNPTVTLSRTGIGGSEEISGADNAISGGYVFTNLFPGDYLLTVSASPYEIKKQMITVNGDMTENVGLGKWERYTSGVTKVLNGIYFTDENNGWAVGNTETILHYNGTSWTDESPGLTLENLRDVYFIDDNDGWAVGNGETILHYNGTSWTDESPGLTGDSENLYGVYFVDSNNGWAVGYDQTILHYDGTGWTVQYLVDGSNDIFYNTYFNNTGKGWATGESGLFYTDDGGTNWTRVKSYEFYDIYFTDDNKGWIAGDACRIMATYDGGDNWELRGNGLIDDLIDLNHIDFPSTNTGWIAGGSAIMVYTADGITWTQQSLPGAINVNDMNFVDNTNGWAVAGGGTIIHYSE